MANICAVSARVWGLGFWVIMFIKCIVDLGPPGWSPLRRQDLTSGQWVAYVLIVVGMWLCEGIGAFQRSFSPMLVRRARELDESSPTYELLLAPGYVAGLFAANRSRLIKSWALIIVLIPGLALSVPYLPYPWREMIDAGVTVGLGWGAICILVPSYVAAVYGRWPEKDPDLPAGTAAKLDGLQSPLQDHGASMQPTSGESLREKGSKEEAQDEEHNTLP